jgi:hypothetical protein
MRLNPMHGPTREAVVVQNILGIEYNQHELPSGYIGDRADDLITLTDAKTLLAEAVDPRVRQSLERKVAILRRDVEDWLSLREQLRGVDWDDRISLWRARPTSSQIQKY